MGLWRCSERLHPLRQTIESTKFALILFLLAATPLTLLGADTCRLAHGDKGAVAIAVGQDPCVTSRHMAGVLQGMLKKITGASFVIESGGGSRFFRLTKESC